MKAIKEKASQIKRRLGDGLRFCKDLFWEAWNDHQFWVHTIAAKSGAFALLAATAIGGLMFTVSLPIAMTAGLVILAGGLVGVGVYGLIAGGKRAKEGFLDILYRVRKKERPPKPVKTGKNLIQKIAENKTVQKIAAHPFTKKLQQTQAWKVLQKIRKKQEHLIEGIAASGTTASAIYGAWILGAQVVALPLVALSTFTTAALIWTIGTGAIGIYVMAKHFRDKVKKLRHHKEQQAKEAQDTEPSEATPEDAQPAPQPLLLLPAPATPEHTHLPAAGEAKKAFTHANDNPDTPPASDTVPNKKLDVAEQSNKVTKK